MRKKRKMRIQDKLEKSMKLEWAPVPNDGVKKKRKKEKCSTYLRKALKKLSANTVALISIE
jgi:hypothetical protein